jgi:hypothetical protein
LLIDDAISYKYRRIMSWVRLRRIGHCYLPFDSAQGGESFDFAQDREPVERLVEPFEFCDLLFVISSFP